MQIQMKKNEEGHVLDLFGDVGDQFDGITTKAVSEVLAEAEGAEKIHVRSNSRGGDVIEGLGIYNLLSQSEAEVTVEVVGVAMSAASLIAMAGDSISVPEAGIVMIHAPWTMVAGNAADMIEAAAHLDMYENLIVDVYASRTGRNRDEVAALVAAETNFVGEEAVQAGFATEVIENKQPVLNMENVAKFSNTAELKNLIEGHVTETLKKAEEESRRLKEEADAKMAEAKDKMVARLDRWRELND